MIAVVDFGSQCTHLIARRIRKFSVPAEIFSPKDNLSMIKNLKEVVLSGGPTSVYSKGAPELSEGLLDLDAPIIGCLLWIADFSEGIRGSSDER